MFSKHFIECTGKNKPGKKFKATAKAAAASRPGKMPEIPK